MSTTTYDPYDVEAARRRVCIKRALRRAGITIPREINENEAALLALAAEHGVTPLTWEEVQARSTEDGQAEAARFNADPHGWTDENGMRRCGRCHEPLIALLPAELTSDTCRCGGLIEADPRNFEPTPAAEPILEGWGALSTTEYREGEEVEVLFPDGWKSGCTFTGYRAARPDEDFLRINVRLPEPGRAAEGCHPDCVRRPFEREARP